MSYEFDGKKYENASILQKEWGNRLVSELEFAGNEKILDLGCGDGKLAEKLSTFVPNGFVLGIDASLGMIDIAKQKEKTNLRFNLMDINQLLLHEKFDIIFSNAALHWVKNHRKLWNNIENLLAPKGIVRFNFAAYGNCAHLIKIIHAAITLDEYKQYFINFEWPWYMPTIEEYKQIVKPLSFSEIKIWGENADSIFSDTESIIGWINQPCLVPFLKQIEESEKEKFRNFVIEHMLQDTAQKDGRYFETFRRINIFVRN